MIKRSPIDQTITAGSLSLKDSSAWLIRIELSFSNTMYFDQSSKSH